jgi:hypothetical protein
MAKAKKTTKKKTTRKTAKKVVKKKASGSTKKKSTKNKATTKKTAKPKKKATKKTTTKTTSKKDKKASKAIRKQVAANKKKDVSQDKEIAKLKEEIKKFKKANKAKKNTKRVSAYNLFIRRQIKSGLTFEKAVKEWNKYKKLEDKDKRKPTAYNQFIGSQMRLGKTFTESVKLWKLAKAGKLGKKGTTRTVTKYKTRTVKSKPKVITKIKRVKSEPKVITKYKTRVKEVPKEKIKVVKQDVDYDRIRAMMTSAMNSSASKTTTTEKSVSVKDIKEAVAADEEEVAFKLVQTYFKEIARFGLKKQLTLDEIIDAYIYSLAKVKRNESMHLENRVKKSGLKR